jgi:hypothetical protein
MNGMVKLSGLWKQKTKDGKPYLSGTIGGAKVLVFPNEYKKTEKDPDYSLFVAPREEKAKAAHEAQAVDPELGF